MNRKERTRVLVEGNRKVLSRMACEAEQLYAVAMVKEPTEELVDAEGARRRSAQPVLSG